MRSQKQEKRVIIGKIRRLLVIEWSDGGGFGRNSSLPGWKNVQTNLKKRDWWRNSRITESERLLHKSETPSRKSRRYGTKISIRMRHVIETRWILYRQYYNFHSSFKRLTRFLLIPIYKPNPVTKVFLQKLKSIPDFSYLL